MPACRYRTSVVYDSVFEEPNQSARTEVNVVPEAIPQPESQEDILDAALAALTEADIPPDDVDWALPHPDSGRPAELAGMSATELEELLAASPAPVPEVIPVGCLPRDGSGDGSGFADGGNWMCCPHAFRWPGSRMRRTLGSAPSPATD